MYIFSDVKKLNITNDMKFSVFNRDVLLKKMFWNMSYFKKKKDIVRKKLLNYISVYEAKLLIESAINDSND